MCKTSVPQWCRGKSNELATETVLVAWTVFVNWNLLCSKQCDRAEPTGGEETKLVHDFSVKSVLHKND